MADGKRPRIWVPGTAYVGDELDVGWGKHVGYNGWGKSFRLSPVGHFGSVRDWHHRAWLVERRELTAEIVDEHAIILAELIVDPDEQPHARRWLAEQPLVCVEGLKRDRLVEAGLRVYTVEHGVESDDLFRIEAAGGKRTSWSLEGRIEALLPAELRPEGEGDLGRSERVELRTFVDRLMKELTVGALREIAVVNALAARSLIEPGYGYHGAPYGEAASIEHVHERLRPLEALFAQVYERARAARDDALAIKKELEGAPADVNEVPIPVYGRALRTELAAIELELGEARYLRGADAQHTLALPAEPRFVVARVEPWSPRLPKDLRERLEREVAASARGVPGWVAGALVAALAILVVLGFLLARP
jgi:hypothetical protein